MTAVYTVIVSTLSRDETTIIEYDVAYSPRYREAVASARTAAKQYAAQNDLPHVIARQDATWQLCDRNRCCRATVRLS